MRTTSESRRARIMAVALDEFMVTGFDGTSMTQIAAHVGGSKATLYSYFHSKDELLDQSLLDYGKKTARELSQFLNVSGDFRSRLVHFVAALLKRLYSSETIGILRLAISVGGTSDVANRFHQTGTSELWHNVALLLRGEIERGRLRAEDPYVMSRHLRTLCKADLVSVLMGAYEPIIDIEAEYIAFDVVELFVRAYGNVEAVEKGQIYEGQVCKND